MPKPNAPFRDIREDSGHRHRSPWNSDKGCRKRCIIVICDAYTGIKETLICWWSIGNPGKLKENEGALVLTLVCYRVSSTGGSIASESSEVKLLLFLRY